MNVELFNLLADRFGPVAAGQYAIGIAHRRLEGIIKGASPFYLIGTGGGVEEVMFAIAKEYGAAALCDYIDGVLTGCDDTPWAMVGSMMKG